MRTEKPIINKAKENYLALVLLIISGIVFSIIAVLSETTLGGGDEITHFRVAQKAFEHPHYFLDHWAKPVYTFFAAPFAQFGITGVRLFSVICGLLAAFFTFRTARLLNYPNAWIAVVFTIFVPIYTMMLISGMTEVMFSLFLIISVFLFVKERYIFSAIVLSFLPFVRNEGIVIFALFGLGYLLYRRYKALPFLLTGFVLLSIVGWFHHHDIFWVITRMPYTGAKDIYGSGALLHFVKSSKVIFGIPLTISTLVGIFIITIRYVQKRQWLQKTTETNEFLIILGSFSAYYAAHSVVWWLGLGGSLGLLRVMAGIVPLMALISLKTINWLAAFLKTNRYLKWGFLVVFLLVVVYTPFAVNKMPVPLSEKQVVVKEAADWLQASEYQNRTIYYYEPYFYLLLDGRYNGYLTERLPNSQQVEMNVLPGSIMMWDAHFSANDGRLPLQRLMESPYYRLIQQFHPRTPFKVLGGHDYAIYAFERTAATDSVNNYELIEKLRHEKEQQFDIKLLSHYDFETLADEAQLSDSSSAYNGKAAFVLGNSREYSPDYQFRYEQLATDHTEKFRAVAFVKPLAGIPPEKVVLVCSAEDERNEIYEYITTNLAGAEPDENGWYRLEAEIYAEKVRSGSDLLKFYVWNQSQQKLLVDDFSVLQLNKKNAQ